MPPTKIKIRNDGPLVVEGDFELVDMDGNAYGLGGRSSIVLCRCGQSGNKPFCDGAHKTCFQDKQQARDLPPPIPKPAPKI